MSRFRLSLLRARSSSAAMRRSERVLTFAHANRARAAQPDGRRSRRQRARASSTRSPRRRAAARRSSSRPSFRSAAIRRRISLLRPAFLDACASELARAGGRSQGRRPRVVGFPEHAATGSASQRGRRAARRPRRRRLSQAAPAELHGLRRGALLRARARRRACSTSTACAAASSSARTAGSRIPRGRRGDAGAQLIVVANGSPYHTRQQAARRAQVEARARETGCRSSTSTASAARTSSCSTAHRSSWTRDGDDRAAAAGVARDDRDRRHSTARRREPVRGALDTALEPHVYQALVMGVRDYVGKNRFPGVLLGLVGRRRFGADAGDRGRCARRRARARGDDAVAVQRVDQPRGRARDGADRSACATTRSRSSPMFDAFLASLARRIRGPAAGRDRGEHPGAHPRHAADGAVEQVRLDRAHDRQQVARWRSATRRCTATWRAASPC